MIHLSPELTVATEPFTHFVSDGVLEEWTVGELSAQLDQLRTHTRRVHSQPGGDKTYAMDFVSLVVGDRETDTVAALPPTWQGLCRSLLDPGFRATVSRQTGIDLTGDHAEIGAYLHRAGDSVSVHRDKQHKTLSCILYLSQEWQATDGGEFLLFADDDLDRPVRRITPRAGRLVVFPPARHSWHAVAPVIATRYLRQTVQVEFAPPGRVDG